MVIDQDLDAGKTATTLLTAEPTSATKPVLSIIIPTYNNAQFLSQAIDSVFTQNFPACEIIVVDDGSTDETQSVLTRYAQRIRYVYQANAGSAAARNVGIGLARGSYVVLLDADDWLLPGKFAAQVGMLEKRPFLGLVHSGWRLVDERGQVIDEVQPWHEVPVLDLDAWVWHKPVQMGAMMFRRTWLEQVGGFDPELRQSQDVDLLLRLALAGCTAAWHQQPTFCYRVHGASTIRKQAPRQYHYLMRVLDKFFADPTVPSHLQAAENDIRYYSLRWIAWHLFETGHLSLLDQPLQEARHYAPFSALETVLDWTTCFAHASVAAKRPLSSLTQLWPTFREVVDLDKPWPLIERLLNWWLLGENEFAVQAWAPLVEMWPLWQTAVPAEKALFVPAETMMDWWQLVWHPFWQGDTAVVSAALAGFSQLSPPRLIALCKWCIVQQSTGIDAAKLASFWQQLQQTGLIPGAEQHYLVSLLLTLFGQLMLRRQHSQAAETLRLACRYSVKYPQSAGHWLLFVKTAVSYFQK